MVLHICVHTRPLKLPPRRPEVCVSFASPTTTHVNIFVSIYFPFVVWPLLFCVCSIIHNATTPSIHPPNSHPHTHTSKRKRYACIHTHVHNQQRPHFDCNYSARRVARSGISLMLVDLWECVCMCSPSLCVSLPGAIRDIIISHQKNIYA